MLSLRHIAQHMQQQSALAVLSYSLYVVYTHTIHLHTHMLAEATFVQTLEQATVDIPCMSAKKVGYPCASHSECRFHEPCIAIIAG